MPDRRREHDHIGNFNFKVEIDGVTNAAFRNVEGLQAEIEVIEYQDGEDLALRKRPGRKSFGDITLKKGYINNAELWTRFSALGSGSPCSAVIYYYDRQGRIVDRWDMDRCWPKTWRLGNRGSSSGVAMEEITLAHEGVTLRPRTAPRFSLRSIR